MGLSALPNHSGYPPLHFVEPGTQSPPSFFGCRFQHNGPRRTGYPPSADSCLDNCIAFSGRSNGFSIAARQGIVCPAQPLWLSTTVLAALVIRHWPTLVWTTAIVARAAPIGSFCPSNCCSPLDCLPRSTALAARHDIFVEPGHNHRSLSSAVCSGTTVPTTRAQGPPSADPCLDNGLRMRAARLCAQLIGLPCSATTLAAHRYGYWLSPAHNQISIALLFGCPSHQRSSPPWRSDIS